MAKCEICGRQPLKGHWRSHSNIKTIRRQKLNLQTKKIAWPEQSRRHSKKMIVCTNCLKTLSKKKTK